LSAALSILRRTRLVERQADQGILARSVEYLETGFELSAKTAREPETLEIVQELYDRVVCAYPRLPHIEGKRILDLACGSATSRAPSGTSRRIPLAGLARNQKAGGYSSLFEPWLCRILAGLGAQPVGVDLGDLEGEDFEHHQADLGRLGALDFLPSHSFDAVHDSRLFGSPEFTGRYAGALSDRAQVMAIAREIAAQEDRLLAKGGIVIHSDAHELAS